MKDDLKIPDSKKELNHYKHEVHCYLDTLWLISSNRRQARNVWYMWLATQMEKDREDTHISKFTLEDCKKALHILKKKYKQLTGKNNISRSEKRKLLQNYMRITDENKK